MYLSSALISIIPVTLKTILQVSEEDQGVEGNEGPRGGNFSKVIFIVVHYLYVISYECFDWLA